MLLPFLVHVAELHRVGQCTTDASRKRARFARDRGLIGQWSAHRAALIVRSTPRVEVAIMARYAGMQQR